MSMLKAKVNAALEKIGTTNGTAAKPSQDPADKAAHEYNVASQMASYADKRKDNAKKALLDVLSEAASAKLEAAKKQVIKTEVSDKVTIIDSEHHVVVAAVNNGASFLDVDSLKVALLKKMTSDEVNALFEANTKRRAPSVTYGVSELITTK